MRHRKCPLCDGIGYVLGKQCRLCNGKKCVDQETFLDFAPKVPCPTCGGSGREIYFPDHGSAQDAGVCSFCNGTGLKNGLSVRQLRHGKTENIMLGSIAVVAGIIILAIVLTVLYLFGSWLSKSITGT